MWCPCSARSFPPPPFSPGGQAACTKAGPTRAAIHCPQPQLRGVAWHAWCRGHVRLVRDLAGVRFCFWRVRSRGCEAYLLFST